MLKSNGLKHAWLGVAITVTLAACGGGGAPGPDNTVQERPYVIRLSQPTERTNVLRNTLINADVHLPGSGLKGVNGDTLKGNVRLYRSRDGQAVPGTPNTDGADGNITFSPDSSRLPDGLLDANTEYTFEVTSGVKDKAGRSFEPFTYKFTTGTQPAPVVPSALFSKTTVMSESATTPFASLVVSPDGSKLYGSTLDGQMFRWAIRSDGTLTERKTMHLAPLSGRPIIGMAFDPEDPNVLWISHNAPIYPQPAPEFSGAIAKLTLQPALDTATTFSADFQPYIVGLPRSTKDHLTNSLAFKPGENGKLYVSQGSNSSTGAADATWNRDEKLLSAAVLEVDARLSSNLPINVQTADTPVPYDPFAPDAPVKIFADGVRNAYDLVWHTNGYLYLPTNGGAAGGKTPGSPDGRVPALQNVPNQHDYLFRTKTAGGYFGHPVGLAPNRAHYVLNGGNPTSGKDPFEVAGDGVFGYLPGTQPDAKYRPPVHDFGANRSPNGATEFKSAAFDRKLQHSLLTVEYTTGNVVVLKLDSGGAVTESGLLGDSATNKVINFRQPIDIVEWRKNGGPMNGYVYVSEIVPGPDLSTKPHARITLLRPAQ